MLYVILLLVVAGAAFFLFKKRADEQKKAAQPIAKKTTTKTKLVEEPVTTQQKTTPLSYDLRNKIEALIKEQNFFSAEAQINQALNRDNKQHELYLFLLEIHILQKDEFAISQLINHIKSLELGEILAQAEQKKEAYDAANKAQINSNTEFHKDDVDILYSAPAAPIEKIEQNTDFDGLMQAPEAIKDEPKSLDFDFSAEKQVVAPSKAVEEKPAPTLEFDSFNFDTAKTSTPTAAEPAAPVLTLDTEVKPVEEPVVLTELKTLDLEFTGLDKPTTDKPVIEEKSTETVIQPLDFSFNLSEPTLTEITTEPAPIEVAAEPAPVAKAEPSLDFDFSTASEAPAQIEVSPTLSQQPNLDFNLLGETAKPVHVDTPPVVESVDENDPLVKSFPDLIHVNEINLNLDLAKQYIQLGAFDAARELLADSTDKYSEEQKLQAQELRNQIA